MYKRSYLSVTPFILTAYPVFYMLSANVGLVDFNDIGLSLLVYEVGTLIVFLLLARYLKSNVRAAFLTSVVVIIFFTYGHIFSLIDAPWGHGLLIPLSLGIIWLSIRVINRKSPWLPGFMQYMAATGGVLVAVAIGTFVYDSLTVSTVKSLSLDTVLGLNSVDESIIDPSFLNYDVPLHIEEGSTLPDIYYIILDEYANSDTLMELHGFDNTPFLDALRQRGFYVAEDSRANYPVTFLSLASSLNMGYLDFLSGHDSDFSVPQHLIDYSRVSGVLRNAGYQIVYFPSIYYVTSGMESADITYKIEREVPILGMDYSNFDLALLDSTMLGALLASSEDVSVIDDYRETTQFALDNLRLIPALEGPTFTFAHLTVPHRPYVFTAEDGPLLADGTVVDGSIIGAGTYAPYTEESDIPAYLDQTNFINRAIMSVVDDILANSSEPPIIIIQSDHGNRMQEQPGVDDWGPAEIYDYVFPILNSYYLPGYEGEAIDQAITPVNTFRLIFDAYFGTNFGFIQNRSFYPEGYFSYDFIEVTNGMMREVPPAPSAED